MKKIVGAIIAAAALGSAGAALANVGVSINIGEPGYYGQIDIGGAPVPELINPAPVVAGPLIPGMAPGPIYLHVPPGYEHHWRRHCREYNACGRPVYFVRDNWYRNVYVQHYHRMHPRAEVRRDNHRQDRRDDHRE